MLWNGAHYLRRDCFYSLKYWPGPNGFIVLEISLIFLSVSATKAINFIITRINVTQYFYPIKLIKSHLYLQYINKSSNRQSRFHLDPTLALPIAIPNDIDVAL